MMRRLMRQLLRPLKVVLLHTHTRRRGIKVGVGERVAGRLACPSHRSRAHRAVTVRALQCARTVPRARKRVCTRKHLLVRRRLPGRAEVVAVRARERLILHAPPGRGVGEGPARSKAGCYSASYKNVRHELETEQFQVRGTPAPFTQVLANL